MMIDLNAFPNQINVVVIGASGGIGQAFIRHLVQQDKVAKIYAFARSDVPIEHAKVIKGKIDLSNEDSIELAAQSIQDVCHIIITATGVLHTDTIAPEKTLRNLGSQIMQNVMQVNFIGPALVGKYFLPLMPRDERAVFAALSARVGSISDNQLGGWYTYRASKAALNMFIKTSSIEIARKYKHASVIGLHPGTVETDLSDPFKGNVPEGKLFTPNYATEKMLEVISNVTFEQTGNLIAYDGEVIAP